MLAEGTEYPLSLEIARRSGHRTVVVVPPGEGTVLVTSRLATLLSGSRF